MRPGGHDDDRSCRGAAASRPSPPTRRRSTCAGAPTGFAPRFSAGSTSTKAGAASSFTLAFSRSDGDELLQRIDATAARRRAAEDRHDAAAAPRRSRPPAPAATPSLIGSVTTAAGPGALPYRLPTGPRLRDRPVQGRAVRARDRRAGAGRPVRPRHRRRAGRRSASTSTPRRCGSPPTRCRRSLQGIPLQLRSVRVAIDKPGFMLNPTGCAPRRVTAAIGSTAGTVANVGTRYQVGGCAALKYTPRLVGEGRRQRPRPRRTEPTPLVATLTQPAGQAASRSVRLALPKAVNARMEVVRRACTQAAYDAGSCGDGGADRQRRRRSRRCCRTRSEARRTSSETRRGDCPTWSCSCAATSPSTSSARSSITRDLRLTTTFDAIPDVPLSRFHADAAGRAAARSARSAGLCTQGGAAGDARSRRCGRRTARSSPARAGCSIAGCKKK